MKANEINERMSNLDENKADEAMSPSGAVRDIEKQLVFIKKKITSGGLDASNTKAFGSAMEMLKKATNILTDVKLLK
jgi:hypothetical protein